MTKGTFADVTKGVDSEMGRLSRMRGVCPISLHECVNAGPFPSWDRETKLKKKERLKAFDLLLKMEVGVHKPGHVVASGSWEWPSADSQQGSRDLSPKSPGTEFCQHPTEQEKGSPRKERSPAIPQC